MMGDSEEEYKIEFQSAGLCQCDRNGFSESGVIYKQYDLNYYFSIYGKKNESTGKVDWYLEPGEYNLVSTCKEKGYSLNDWCNILLDRIQPIVEQHPEFNGVKLILDLSKCEKAW